MSRQVVHMLDWYLTYTLLHHVVIHRIHVRTVGCPHAMSDDLIARVSDDAQVQLPRAYVPVHCVAAIQTRLQQCCRLLAATRVSATCLGRTACWFYLRFNEHKCSTAEFNRTIETLTTCWKWRACAEDVHRPTDVALLGCHHYKYQIITDRVNGQDIVIGRVRLSVCFHSLFWTNRPLTSIFACVLLMTIARRGWTVEATCS